MFLVTQPVEPLVVDDVVGAAREATTRAQRVLQRAADQVNVRHLHQSSTNR